MRQITTLIALLLLSSSVTAQSSEAISEFMEARWQAWDNRDANTTASFYSEDATTVNVTGNQLIGREAIEAWYQRLFGGLFPKDLGPRRCQEATIQLIEDDVAIVTQECTWYDVVPPEKIEGRRLPIRRSRVTHVLADRGMGWKIVGFRNIPIWNPFKWEGTNH
jgi:uncharacterized protein (TIGR02246 family)